MFPTVMLASAIIVQINIVIFKIKVIRIAGVVHLWAISKRFAVISGIETLV